MSKDSITTLILFMEKYRKQMKETSIYIEYAVLKEVVEDLEQLKDVLKGNK
jgi:adenine C2-methylase RlmN of 23S rRNA A2503 and tRNA A37